jgi:hypothetical protein
MLRAELMRPRNAPSSLALRCALRSRTQHCWIERAHRYLVEPGLRKQRPARGAMHVLDENRGLWVWRGPLLTPHFPQTGCLTRAYEETPLH